MIDLSCHLLDGAGCGPSGFAEGAEMCRLMRGEGVRTAVATPRWARGAAEPPLAFEECERRLARLRREAGEGLSLRLGFVLPFGPELPALVARHGARLALGGGRHLLVALPALEAPAGAEEVWGELARMGFGVVVARPECSPALRRDPGRLDRWVAGGLVVQLDAAGVAGAYGREVRRFAWRCLRRYGAGGVVLASNARDASARRPSLRRAAEEAARRLGTRRALALVRHTPARLVDEDGRAAPALPRANPLRSWAAALRSLLPTKAVTEES